MKNIRRLSLSEQVVNSIIQYIQENGLNPGDQLPTENKFAESLGVSRTSIREAIKALSINGILRSIPGKGTFLEPKAATLMLERDGLLQMEAQATITEVMEVRAPLEIQAVALAVERCNEEDIAALKEISLNYEKAVQSGGVHSVWGQKFHARIAQASRNPMLISVLQSLAYMTDLYRGNLAEKDIGVEYFAKSHWVIAEAFRAHDVAAATTEMKAHMEHTLCVLTRMVASDNATRFIPQEVRKYSKRGTKKAAQSMTSAYDDEKKVLG